MAIEVPCSGCGRKLQVGPEHAGKMARCPVCGHITRVPAGSETAGAAPAETDPAVHPAANWYMRTPEGQEYGPVSRGDLDRWVAEGRVTFDCQLRDGDAAAWQSADEIFPALRAAAPTPLWTPPVPLASGAAGAGSFYADRPAGSPFPPAPVGGSITPMRGYQTPHRGALILVLGLLGFFACFIFGIMAWVMGSNDLAEMEAGRMDRSGMDLTRAGMILGMIISLIFIASLLLGFGFIFLGALVG